MLWNETEEGVQYTSYEGGLGQEPGPGGERGGEGRRRGPHSKRVSCVQSSGEERERTKSIILCNACTKKQTLAESTPH